MQTYSWKVMALVGLLFGELVAFPLQLGMKVEYDVTRGMGAERSILALLPFDSFATSSGVDWKIGVVDSLVGGKRATMDNLPLRKDTVVVHVDDTSMVWTDRSCMVSWDFGRAVGYPTNRYAFGCSQAFTPDNGTQLGDGQRQFGYVGVSIHSSSFRWTFPAVRGIWSEDSGWIAMLDDASGESWTLRRIGAGSVLAIPLRLKARPGIELVAGDQWVWRVVRAVVDSSPDTSMVTWAILGRQGDSGVVGRWNVARRTDTEAAETLEVDFDSPANQLDAELPVDPVMAMFRKGGMQPWFGSRKVSWEYSNYTYRYSETRSATRECVYVEGMGIVSSVHSSSRTSSPLPGAQEQTVASTLSISLVSRNSVPVQHIDAASRFVAPDGLRVRDLDELDRFVDGGGRTLSAMDCRGRSMPINARPSSSLRNHRGILLVDVLDGRGRRASFRLLLP